jgi:hypothetical protein
LAFSPNGRLLAAGGFDSPVRIWDPTTGKELRQLSGYEGYIYRLTFSADGKTLAGGSPNAIHLWETATGQERCRFLGHRGHVPALTLAPDGRRLASGSSDCTVLVWDMTGRLRDGRLLPAGLSARELGNLWADLASDDAAKAYRALWLLAAAPRQSLPLLENGLRPAQVDAAQLARLIGELNDEEFAVRERASAELQKMGDVAEAALRRAAANSDAVEVRRRAERLLEKLDAPDPSPTHLRELRGLEVLEHIGTPEAQRLLQTLAGGAKGALLTREAQASLDRLTRRAQKDR